MSNYFSHELKENEEIIRIVRKHWITFVTPFVKILIAIVPPFFFITFFLSSPPGTIAFVTWLILSALYAIIQWVKWYLDSFIVTNTRIIDIDQRGLFNRTVSETEIEKIQDVSYSIHGFFATLFGYGTCTVETAGTQTMIKLKHIRHPQELHRLLVELQRKS